MYEKDRYVIRKLAKVLNGLSDIRATAEKP